MSDSVTTVPPSRTDAEDEDLGVVFPADPPAGTPDDTADAPADSSDDSPDDREAAAGRRFRPRLPRALRPRRPGPVAALLILALVLAGAGGWLGLQVRQHDRRAQQGEAAVAATSEVVGLLWTVDATSSKDVFATLLAGTTGSLRSQLSQASGTFQQVLLQQKVSSSGSVVEAGLTELDGDRATVLVAANATITQADGKSDLRQYRMRGTVERLDGRWLVSNLEFVA